MGTSPAKAPPDKGKAKDGEKSGKAHTHRSHLQRVSRMQSSSVDRSEDTPLLDDQSSDGEDVEAQRASTDHGRPPSRTQASDPRQSRFRSCANCQNSCLGFCVHSLMSWLMVAVRFVLRNCCIIMLSCILAAITIALGVYFERRS
jgi:hypothetical protein